MREISFEESKKIGADILTWVHTVCEKHKIRYYLAYGTLLGAVRHKGFIPWDDDVDVVMDRDNFERFILAAREEKNERYRLAWLTEDQNYDLPLPKVIDTKTELVQSGRKSNLLIGVWVDILILDDVPDDLKKQKKVLKRFDFYESVWNFSQYESFAKLKGKTLKSKIRYTFMKILALPGSRFWAKRLYQMSGKYNKKSYSNVACLSFLGLKRKAYQKTWFAEGSLVEFEGKTYIGPKDAEAWLRRIYGEWWVLPPEDQRTCRHEYTVYYKDENK